MGKTVSHKERAEFLANARAAGLERSAGVKPPERRAAYKKFRRAWMRQTAIAGGPCSTCGKRRARPARAECTECTIKYKESPNRAVNKMKAELEQLRKVRDQYNALLARIGRASR